MAAASDIVDDGPFHPGERAVQARVGAIDMHRRAAKAIRDYMPDQHRTFFAELPFLAVAARDAAGRPWATMLAGRPGFVASPDERTLAIAGRAPEGDALEDALRPGAKLGALGIAFGSRRRNRANGHISDATDDGIVIAVEQSFGNCPKYINRRDWREAPAPPPAAPRRSANLDAGQRRRIAAADTFFIASGHGGEGPSAAKGLDASHRGGAPGFVRVLDDRRLQFPDYAGNNYFNTLGNLELDPRAGITFIDFETGDLLQLAGRITIDWNEANAAETYDGARRILTFEIDQVVDNTNALPLRWKTATVA